MSANQTFGGMLSSWLQEEAEHRVPDHLEEVLVVTAATRQRPWWSSPERWLPMDLATRLLPTPTVRLGRILVVAALLIALAAVAILLAGSRPRLPAPFGVAGNGAVISSADGDIHRIDPVTGVRTPLIADPAYDFSAVFSRDGTRMVFLRSDEEPVGEVVHLTLMLADADGSDVVALTPPIRSPDWYDWSPSGDRIAFLSRDERGRGLINVIDVASRAITTLDVGTSAHFLTWLPPTGAEIVFRAEGPSPELRAVDPVTGTVRTLTTQRAGTEHDVQSVVVAPDGRTAAFIRWRRGFSGQMVRVLDLTTGIETRVPGEAGRNQASPVFSSDSRSIAYVRVRPDETAQVVVAPLDGSSDAVELGPIIPLTDLVDIGITIAFVPDGSAVVVRYGRDDTSSTRWLPVTGEPGRIVEEGVFSFVDVQRVAP